jgi:hypothetical protein
VAMDDTRIRALTDEVMASLDRDQTSRTTDSLEARVGALEAAVSRLTSDQPAAVPPPRAPRGHVSLTVLDVPGGGDRCVLEPDQPCTNSGTCRSFGH